MIWRSSGGRRLRSGIKSSIEGQSTKDLDRKLSTFAFYEQGKLITFAVGTQAARYRENVEDPRSLGAWTSRIALNVLSDQRRRTLAGGHASHPLAALKTIESTAVHVSRCAPRGIP